MAQIVMKFRAGTDIVQEEKNIERQIFRIHQSAAQVNRSMSAKLKSMSQIKAQMQQILRQLEMEKARMNDMHRAMEMAAEKYRDTEERIVGAAWAGVGADKGPGQDHAGEGQGGQKKDLFDWAGLWKKIIGKFGVAGNLPLVIAGWKDASGIKKIKDIVKLVSKGASMVGNKGVKWKGLVGMPDLGKYKGLKDQPFKKAVSFAAKEEWEGYVFDKSKTGAEAVANKFKVVAKWAGGALTVADNWVKNSEEHGGASGSRFWQEFVTESAIDIGKDALIAVAAGAVAGAVAAAGAATAPVWLTSIGVSVGLSWGADQLAKLVTGDSNATATEAISDAVWDHAVPWLKERGNDIANAFGNAASAVKGWLDKPQWAFGW